MRLLSSTSVLLALCLLPFPVQAQEPAVATALQPFVDRGTLAGAVTLVASQDKVLSLEAVGYADVAAKKPMRTDCLFWIASHVQADHGDRADDAGRRGQGDVWTTRWRSICRSSRGRWLVVEKDDDHVAAQEAEAPDHGEEHPHAHQRPAVQVGHGGADARPAAAQRRRAQLRHDAAGFRAGQQYHYCNAGINTAGRIIEVVSGMPYEEFLRRAAVPAAGDEGHDLLAQRASNCAAGQSLQARPQQDGLVEDDDRPAPPIRLPTATRQPMPAGGLFSTAADLCPVLPDAPGRRPSKAGAVSPRRP